ncbi:MAG: hypothetical protein MRZ97_04650 [Firmicutes bacterium]|nr:hypothetical protein [Bacillota bacterium]
MRIQRSLKHKKNKRIYIPFLILFSLQLLFLAAGLTGCGQTDETACEALFFSETVMKPAEKTETVTCRWASREAALLLQETWAKEYGSSSEPASEEQLTETICFLLNLYDGSGWEKYRKELTGAVSKLPEGQGNLLTRHEAAVLLSTAYEEAFGMIQEETQYLPEIAFRFAEACFYRFQLEEGGVSSEKSKKDLEQKKAGIADFARKMVRKTAGREDAAENPEIVVNQREGGDYVSQMDESEYENVNCLPACAAMAAGYCRDERYTGADMRNLLPEISGGWTLEQTQSALTLAGVDSEIQSFSVEELHLQLEVGRVAIVQINEGNPAGSGHSLYVYGFRRYGSSLLFLVHDPLERTDVLRERVSGERIVMDSSQLAFLVNRFCERFLVCIP